jgi:hypothetical protein
MGRKKGVVLVERDYRVMRFLAEMRFASIEQLRRAFFEWEEDVEDKGGVIVKELNLAKNRTYQRVRKLRESGYVFDSAVVLNGIGFLVLSEKGLAAVREFYGAIWFPNAVKDIDFKILKHN